MGPSSDLVLPSTLDLKKNSDKCVCHLGSPWPRISADGDKVDDDCSESEMEKADDHVE